MYKLLYLVRAEADFERVLALAITGKNRFDQKFIFTADGHPLFSFGIASEFQKSLFAEHGFQIKDFCDYDAIGAILKKLSVKRDIPFDAKMIGSISQMLWSDRKSLIPTMFLFALKIYLIIRAPQIAKKILKRMKPDALLTDASVTTDHCIPEIFRRTTSRMGIPTFIFNHGVGAALHPFALPEYYHYENCCVFACNDVEAKQLFGNGIVLGDVRYSFPYVNYIHRIDNDTLSFLDDREFRIAFMVTGYARCATSGWPKMEEIIIELADNLDVAMVIKKHPRGEYADLSIVSTFSNVKIVGSWCGTSRVVKWADIVVCDDYCSTVFEPMILGKKVVAVEGKYTPRYKDKHSPLKYSSVKHISSASEFDLNSIPNANPEDQVTNRICWGNHGKIDLAKLLLERVEEIIEHHPPTRGIGRNCQAPS